MPFELPYRELADAVLVVHVAVALFVVGGLPLIVIGNASGWRWVNGWAFRLAHLAAIGVVVAESLAGWTCPLTSLESWLRVRAGQSRYAQGFIEHWLSALLFHDAPAWVFATAYVAFGLLVVLAWWYFPPQRRPPASASGP